MSEGGDRMPVTITATEEHGTGMIHTEGTELLTISQAEKTYADILYVMVFDLYERQKDQNVTPAEILKTLTKRVCNIKGEMEFDS
jgi:hypothetical protein